MCKTMRLSVLALIAVARLPAYAAPVAAQAQLDVSPEIQISHEIRATLQTAGEYQTGTPLALGVITSSVPFTSLNLKWDRSINPPGSVAREAYAVDPATKKKIPVTFEVEHGDRMVNDEGSDSVNVIFNNGARLSEYGYSVILTRGETLSAGAYPVGILADVTVA
ncbi:hypothetical protein [Escherichia coli]|uniref:hypothetical protein n=1 Tax=Escherichia coli TaxID=562 RepID=UPI00191838C0|nr:hypothetical protein [Escherichia coli]CAD6107044.1 Uncharacterised protein [Escherichia coli]CAD6111367.1 Uncharacterised protein [Escherichia coli]CAD6181122.1 Uncharacterised protein [Escherichia coli]